ncbi:hypothetical protein HZH68_004372 [Vespula germanica]|uniref:Uncharacterized protein n=1 Tax=Vespula germanica TaxID=30212 RepID=A0A834KQE7_VESGE|nr:hypothetical protein HZH68_004372 [Vespula germanica]
MLVSKIHRCPQRVNNLRNFRGPVKDSDENIGGRWTIKGWSFLPSPVWSQNQLPEEARTARKVATAVTRLEDQKSSCLDCVGERKREGDEGKGGEWGGKILVETMLEVAVQRRVLAAEFYERVIELRPHETRGESEAISPSSSLDKHLSSLTVNQYSFRNSHNKAWTNAVLTKECHSKFPYFEDGIAVT